MVFGNREELGHWTGKENRVVALVMDEGFARRLLELSDQQLLQKNAEAKI
jgi:ribosomal protein L7Ae-like RNA K-turn-binding protein